MVAGVGLGETTIWASFESSESGANVEVVRVDLNNIRIFPDKAQIPVGFETQYEAIAMYKNGGQEDVTMNAIWSVDEKQPLTAIGFFDIIITRNVTWSSSSAKVLSIEPTGELAGLMEAKSAGSAVTRIKESMCRIKTNKWKYS